eukprot:TRINITY_DN4827_c0_g1_i5.p1 TRINITY_DN4827_c0_g1~~TRINITY_DN4827_c0_g1_i5.p1  ORF type:complete len:519 (+),score=138.92 TRINITY_DN4827_c0_g1_i5:166-1722(+)
MLKRKTNSMTSQRGFLSNHSSKSSTGSARESSNDSYSSAKASPKFSTKLNFNRSIKKQSILHTRRGLGVTCTFRGLSKKDSADYSEDSKGASDSDSNDPPVKTQSVATGKIKPEDAMFIIKDVATGIEYDIRDPSTLARLNSNLSSFSSEYSEKNAWQDWWKQKKEVNAKLLQAAETGDLATVESLLDRSLGDKVADVNTRSAESYTPLHFAAREGRLEMVSLLIERGANVHAQTKELRTPLHIACIKGHIAIIEELAMAEAEFNVNDKDGNTPAHLLAKYGWEDALERILKYQPDLTMSNNKKQTALNLVSKKALKAITSMTEQGLANALREVLPPIVHQPMPALDIVDSDSSIELEEPIKIDIKDENNSDSQEERRVKQVKIEPLSVQLPEDDKSSFKTTTDNADMSVQRSILMDLDSGFTGTEGFTPMQLLGKGDHGEIYAIKSKATGELFAMKMIKKEDVELVNLYAACVSQDSETLNYPVCPFVVGLEFAFQALDYYLFVTKYCPGLVFSLTQ